MFVLDSDIVQLIHANNPKVVAKLSAVQESDAVTTIVTRAEILRGRLEFLLKASNAAQILRAQHWLTESELLLDRLKILQFDVPAGEHFERLRSIRGLGRVGRADLLIASMVLAHNAVLVTRNTKDFVRIPNLKLENWLDD